VVAVADHQPSTILELRGVVLDIDRDFGLQRRCQHLPGTVADDLIEQRPTTAAGACALDSDSSSTTLSTGVPSENQRANAGPDQNLPNFAIILGKVRHFHVISPGAIHRF